MSVITPNLWFDTEALDAAEYYAGIIPGSRINDVSYYGDGKVLTVAFELDCRPFLALNGGPHYTFNEAISLVVNCDTQADVDSYWKLLSEGGEEGQCGWLKDKYGLSWQIVPSGMGEILGDPDPERAGKAMQAMQGMRKLDINALREAAAAN
jgi:predicted 3-demethylubiquinone-9 3-methyltransferase (glyoxalase superfamily)